MTPEESARKERLAVEQIKAIILDLRRTPEPGETHWDEDGPARHVIRTAMRETNVNGLSGCPLCCS